MSGRTVHDYHVGWICALNEELAAAMAMLDEEHDMLARQDPQDRNSYILGRVHQHHVVITGMPKGVDGLVSAANAARDMARTFPALRIGLLVGIGGGIPNLAQGVDIRLGDVVVSTPQKARGGVVQYDKGKAEEGGQFVVKGQLNQPPTLLLNAVTQLQARHKLRPSKITTYIDEAIQSNPMLVETGFSLPSEPDYLYCGFCDRNVNSSVAGCKGTHIHRKNPKRKHPEVHYGVIASGNYVVKDATFRDRLQEDFGAICVEMEAAGLMNDFPCLVVRGICDYADKHKNDVWHSYAAMTAAAFTKELLQHISPVQTSQEQPVQEILGLLNDINRTFQAHVEATHTLFQQSKIHYESEKHAECHRALKIGPYEEQKNINPERVDGTCQWVSSHSQYEQWSTTAKDDLLWISADPGCGKSVLARSLIEHELRSTSNHSVCYFFFKDNEQQDNVATALCALLHQLISQQPRLVRYVIPAWEEIGNKITKDVSELWRTLLAAATNNEAQDVTCVLDAMDECRPTDRRSLIRMLADFQNRRSSIKTRKGRLKFLITSRPYEDIETEFGKALKDVAVIRLRGEEENDMIHQEIDRVIGVRVHQLAVDLPLDEQIENQLLDKLLQMKHRTYLWLHLAMDDIAQTYRQSLRPSETLIDSLPKSVEAAYEKILTRVSDQQRGNVKMILQIVVGARRPLTVHEMAIALGIATSTGSQSLDDARLDPIWLERRIRDWCGLFIFINHEQIYLIHQTAKEFLVGSNHFTSPLPGWKHCLNLRELAKEMTRICVGFLCSEEVKTVADQIYRRAGSAGQIKIDRSSHVECFLHYAAEHWPGHLREAQLPENDILVGEICSLYDTDSSLYAVWFPLFWEALKSWRKPPQMTRFHLGALLGHKNVLQYLCQIHDGDYDINVSDKSGQTALMWACEFNHENVIQLLLDNGAGVNAQGGQYGSALRAASCKGHEKVVRILLDNRADVNTQGGYYGSALQAASFYGDENIVRMLLDNGADINAQGGGHNSALQSASLGGHENVVRILLDNGANVNTQGGYYSSALQAASYRGHENVVRMLLDNGADVNAQGGDSNSALQSASLGGHEEVVRMLLDNGADVNTQGGYYGSALQAASYRGHKKVVQILLDNGADVNAQGGGYGSALQAAFLKGHEKVVRMLLDNGADINAQGGGYDSALQAVSLQGHEKVVQILREAITAPVVVYDDNRNR